MRFSLKWLLAGTVYVAIAAAAFARPHWAYGDVLWGITFFAIVYGVTLAILARGRGQAAAIGFTVASGMVVLCLHFSRDSVPTSRLIMGLAPGQFVTQTYTVMTAAPDGSNVPETRTRTVYLSPSMAALPRTAFTASTVSLESWQRYANAIATMAAGLVGAVLGIAAYRRGWVEREGE